MLVGNMDEFLDELMTMVRGGAGFLLCGLSILAGGQIGGVLGLSSGCWLTSRVGLG